MKLCKILALATASVLMAGSAAYAGCGISSGKISFVGNDFPAIQAVAAGVKACEGDGVTVTINLNKDYDSLAAAALTAKPSQYSAVHATNTNLAPLVGSDLIRPLDDLVKTHGQGLEQNQLITIDGKVVAVAFAMNAQHLFYRKDILDKLGLQPPKTYEEVLEVAKAAKAAGLMKYPFVISGRAGWNLGQEFVNMYIGEGGAFFKPGTAEVAINNEQGVKALTMLKDLTAFANPDFLAWDATDTQAQWISGEGAIGNLWGSRASAILDGASPDIANNTVVAAAPTVDAGTLPATTLWWDGFAIATNVSDAEAEATFIAMMQGISPENILPHSSDAVWLVKGYEPTPASAGVIATLNAGGAQSYPYFPYIGLLHTALGDTLPKFFQGQSTAEQTLADVEAAYTTAAKAQGFLK
jgi:ABC-type glycerol-3-phosphate transport system substrate-binding protein